MKRAVRLILSCLLSIVFLWLAFRKVEVGAVWSVLTTINLPFVGLYVLTVSFTQLARAFRWAVLTRPFVKLDLAAAIRISNLGNMLILLLPLRLGELARPYLLKREAGASMSAGMGAVVVERAIDGLLVALLFFVTTLSLAGSGRVPPGLQIGAWAAVGIFGGLTVAVFVILVANQTAARILQAIVRPLSPALAQRLGGMLESFVTGLRSLPDARAASSVVLWTLAYWATSGLGYWWAMHAFGWDLPLSAGFTLVSVIVIGIMIPAGPGFLGTFQGAVLMGLAIYGIDTNHATAYGLVVYLLQVLVVLAFGLPHLFHGQTRIREMVEPAPG